MSKFEATDEQVQYIIDNAKLSDNELLGNLVQMGVPFNNTKALLKTVLEENGLRMSKAQRDAKAAELLESFEATAETELDEITEIIENLVDELDCTAKVARSYVRAEFEKEELTMPKATGGGGKRGPRAEGFSGDAEIVANAVIENPEITEDQLRKIMEDLGKDKTNTGNDKVSRWYPFVGDLRVFGRAWQAKHC